MHPYTSFPSLFATLLFCATTTITSPGAEQPVPQWPQFRGPGGNAIATTQTIPPAFGPTKNVRWKTAVPAGRSSPCVWADRIFVTGHVGKNLKMICVRRSDGKVLWERERTIPKLLTYEHVAGNPANSTPVTGT